MNEKSKKHMVSALLQVHKPKIVDYKVSSEFIKRLKPQLQLSEQGFAQYYLENLAVPLDSPVVPRKRHVPKVASEFFHKK
jgi:hypothetical protein